MPTEAEDALADVYEGRGEAREAGFWPHRLTLVIRYTQNNPRAPKGEEQIAITEANGQPPKIRVLNQEERTIGGLPEGAIEVGPITPAFPGGGTDIALLSGSDLGQGDVLIFRVDGPMYPNGAYFSKQSLTHDRALRIMLRLVPREQA